MPRRNDPERTVTTSGTGCVCGATRYPFGNLSRSTNKPSLLGSPKSTAACAPAGSTSGAGPHLTSCGKTILCASDDWAVTVDVARPTVEGTIRRRARVRRGAARRCRRGQTPVKEARVRYLGRQRSQEKGETLAARAQEGQLEGPRPLRLASGRFVYAPAAIASGTVSPLRRPFDGSPAWSAAPSPSASWPVGVLKARQQGRHVLPATGRDACLDTHPSRISSASG
jgi:hypothetical protein